MWITQETWLKALPWNKKRYRSKTMEVICKHYTPLDIASQAIRTCWQSFEYSDDGGSKDKELIHRVGNIFRHSSTLEHLYYNFEIKGLSRGALQELSRHRIASLSVKSSRYTLRELKEVESFLPLNETNLARAKEFLVFVDNEKVDAMSVLALENLRVLLSEHNIKNDLAKYAMPESYKTHLAYSINARSLQNLLTLRSSNKALKEMQDLAKALFDALPCEHQYLFEDCLKR